MVILGRALPLHHSPPPPTTFVVVVDVPPPPHSLNRPHTTKRTRTHPNTLRQAPSPTRPRRHRCRPSPPPPNNVEEERERRGTLPERPTRLCGAAFSPAAAAIYALNNTRRPLPAHKRRQRLPLQPPFPSPPTVVAPLKRNQSLFPPAAVTLVLDTQPPVTPKPANGGHQRSQLTVFVARRRPSRPRRRKAPSNAQISKWSTQAAVRTKSDHCALAAAALDARLPVTPKSANGGHQRVPLRTPPSVTSTPSYPCSPVRSQPIAFVTNRHRRCAAASANAQTRKPNVPGAAVQFQSNNLTIARRQRRRRRPASANLRTENTRWYPHLVAAPPH
ncbi:hypothetical protein D9619_009804 [Psilocybe cf. subviscida]|uniref:Uncharacterized protein n=1 Tax=Psilocybe cf. subviscida TaxID=2480587 RepID=A0A8H5BND9_9AGAR|nr:hypothetical protein D9619_009804 [Psilocybe cf. subviscida]